MSVVICGMKMPTSCDKCIYSAWSNFYQIYVCNAVRKNEPVLFDGKQTKSTAVARSARADNCPLIPVPDHGGLIDKRKVVQTVYDYCHTVDGKYCGPDDVGELWDEMKAMPAIIPASEEGV